MSELKNKCCVKCGREKQLVERTAYFHGEEFRPDGSMTSFSVTVGVMVCKPCNKGLPKPKQAEIQKLSHKLQIVKVLIENLGCVEGKA